MSRWQFRVPTKAFAWIGAASTVVSVAALTIAIMALNSSVQQQTRQATRDSEQAAVIAAARASQEASHQSACRFYAFTIGDENAPPRSTEFGRYQLREARKAFREEGCVPIPSEPSSFTPPTFFPLPSQSISHTLRSAP